MSNTILDSQYASPNALLTSHGFPVNTSGNTVLLSHSPAGTYPDPGGDDTQPAAFSFGTNPTGLALSAGTQTSDAATITDITAASAFTFSGTDGSCEWRKNGGSWVTTGSGSCVDGDTLQLRHTAGTGYSQTVSGTITFTSGSVSATFSSTTIADPVSGDPTISSITGTPTHGSDITINGADFGIKTEPRPQFWAPMDGSAAPSSLGVVTSWAEIQDMAYDADEGPGGYGCLKASSDSGVWTARVDAVGFDWSDPGQKMYLFRKLKQNFSVFTPERNFKTWRCWGDRISTVDNGLPTSIMAGLSNGTFGMDHLVTPAIGHYPFDDQEVAAFGPVDEWYNNEILLLSNSAADEEDAEWRYKTNGVVYGNQPYTAWDGLKPFKIWDGDTNPQLERNYIVHAVLPEGEADPADRYWAADVYLDKTWARVMIGNASTLAACTHLEIQIPTSWSGTSVGVRINRRTFPGGDSPYLFVVNEDDVASVGFAL